jgi:hypothetical protein
MNAEEMGQALGPIFEEVNVLFLAIVNALRKQPGFDDDSFCQEIQILLARDDLSAMQRSALSVLLNNEIVEGDC